MDPSVAVPEPPKRAVPELPKRPELQSSPATVPDIPKWFLITLLILIGMTIIGPGIRWFFIYGCSH